MHAVLAARALAYDVLKCTFLQGPSKALLNLLIEDEFIQVFSFASTDVLIAQAVDSVKTYLRQPGVRSQENCDRLRWDYTRLFIGPGRVPAPPWESIYRNVEHLYYSTETLEVREAYRKYNLSHRNLGREPDDHLGLELDFLRQLCLMAEQKARATDQPGLTEILQDQSVFLSEHVLKWVPEWTRDVVSNAETEFYKGMAQLADAYVRFDRELTDKLLEALQAGPSAAS